MSNIENSIKRPENGQTIVGIYLIHPEDRRSVKSGGIFLGKSKFHSVPHVISSNRNWRFEKWLNLFCCSRHSEPKFAKICMKPWNIDICQLWKMSKNKGECILKHRAQVVLRWVVDYIAGGLVVMKGKLAMLVSMICFVLHNHTLKYACMWGYNLTHEFIIPALISLRLQILTIWSHRQACKFVILDYLHHHWTIKTKYMYMSSTCHWYHHTSCLYVDQVFLCMWAQYIAHD